MLQRTVEAMWKLKVRIIAAVVLFTLLASVAGAQRHRSSGRSSGRGVPCGRSYISSDKVCHKDTTTAPATAQVRRDTSIRFRESLGMVSVPSIPVPVATARGTHTWNGVF